MRPTLTAMALLISLLVPFDSHSQIYRCQTDSQTLFSDRPCGAGAEVVTVEPARTGGRLDTGADFRFEPPAPRQARASRTGCARGYIQSTELRRLRVKSRVEAGMSATQVRYILGDPDHHAGQWWVYQRRGKETGRYLIRSGCLVSWR
ncbi:hypothetical protein [Marinobacter salicampi]|uniref:hypothetical protein n=1 Tax=Marinobacter salicampi TaxID=435907 RepID=UPI00140E7718|nr:hypothetical protein [Marinobacter salicampi]